MFKKKYIKWKFSVVKKKWKFSEFCINSLWLIKDHCITLSTWLLTLISTWILTLITTWILTLIKPPLVHYLRIFVKIKTKNFTNSPTWKFAGEENYKRVKDAVAYLFVFASSFFFLHLQVLDTLLFIFWNNETNIFFFVKVKGSTGPTFLNARN